jgi:hypothetical protein
LLQSNIFSTFTFLEIHMINTEQIVASNKAALNTAFALSNDAFSSVEKLVELNLTAARSSLTESADFFKSLMGAKDPQQFLALQSEFSNLWLKRLFLTHVTCMRSLLRQALKWARLLKPKPLKHKSSS